MISLFEFNRPFDEVYKLLLELPILNSDRANLTTVFRQTQAEIEFLATHDRITLALNRRGEWWYVNPLHIKSVAKIDIYDMRQANRVYGVAAVDSDLRRISHDLRRAFPIELGAFVRRSTGSDEFYVFSTNKTVNKVRQILKKINKLTSSEGLLSWDFGVGSNGTEAEIELYQQKRLIRPMVIRQIDPDAHAELTAASVTTDEITDRKSFTQPFQEMQTTILTVNLSAISQMALLRSLQSLEKHAEQVITTDELTEAKNRLGRKWYFDKRQNASKAIIVTDMLDMHEGNLRYGSDAIEKDLQRFSLALRTCFPLSEGYLVFRSEKAGDEFVITSETTDSTELEKRFERFHIQDTSTGLLYWHYGIGKDEAEAHQNLYARLLRSREASMHGYITPSKSQIEASFFIIAKPDLTEHETLLSFAQQLSTTIGGSLIGELHFTLQSMNGNVDEAILQERLKEYCSSLEEFDVHFQQLARVNVPNYPPRIWLIANKDNDLSRLYSDLAKLAHDLGLKPYPYPVENWRPHMKVVVYNHQAPPNDPHTLFGITTSIKIRVRKLTLTKQINSQHWHDVGQFLVGK